MRAHSPVRSGLAAVWLHGGGRPGVNAALMRHGPECLPWGVRPAPAAAGSAPEAVRVTSGVRRRRGRRALPGQVSGGDGRERGRRGAPGAGHGGRGWGRRALARHRAPS